MTAASNGAAPIQAHDWRGGTVLVAGASSQIGYFLLPRLVRSGAHVLALSRTARRPLHGVEWLQGALPDAPAAAKASESVCCFAPLQALAGWIERGAGDSLRRVVATSSMSVHSKQDSPVPTERALARRLQEGESALARACAARGIAWTILRPTLIYGAARDRSLTPLVRRGERWRVFALPAGAGLRQPVHAADVAEAVLRALAGNAAGHVLAIGGGERLPAAEMFRRVRASVPVATLPVPLPGPLVRLAARLLPPLRGPLTRLDQDLVADNTELERLLDVHPRGFAPDHACWARLP